MIAIENIRQQFPIFASAVSGGRLGYLDSAASAQKPASVIDCMADFYRSSYANVQRGAYELSAQASERVEQTRARVARFIGASSDREVVFTRGTTESLNLVSFCLAEILPEGSTVLITELEHHSNIVPWQLAEKRQKLKVRFAPITQHADLNYAECLRMIAEYKPQVVSITHLSNAFGTPIQVATVAEQVHRYGGIVIVDCAQSIAHQSVNVRELGADCIVFSGHKLYGPSGIGVLWVREDLLSRFEPYQGGGGMISMVTKEGTTWADYPQRFEAGTPAIAEIVGLGRAIEFLEQIGFSAITTHENQLFDVAWNRLREMSGIILHGPRSVDSPQTSIISFSVEGVHPHDLATVLDQHNVQIRAGHHCAMPALTALGLPATARISFGVYSELADIEQLAAGIISAQRILL